MAVIVRAAENTEEATHRYPTLIHWGAGYFDDGMRYLVASNRDAALASAQARSASTAMMHLQERDHSGRWRFSRELIQENEDTMRACAEQPGVLKLMEG